MFCNLLLILISNTLNFECRIMVESMVTSVTIYLSAYLGSKELIYPEHFLFPLKQRGEGKERGRGKGEVVYQ